MRSPKLPQVSSSSDEGYIALSLSNRIALGWWDDPTHHLPGGD